MQTVRSNFYVTKTFSIFQWEKENVKSIMLLGKPTHRTFAKQFDRWRNRLTATSGVYGWYALTILSQVEKYIIYYNH